MRGEAFVALDPAAVVEGRRVLVGPRRVLAACLARAPGLFPGGLEGPRAAQVLDTFADQPAVVLEVCERAGQHAGKQGPGGWVGKGGRGISLPTVAPSSARLPTPQAPMGDADLIAANGMCRVSACAALEAQKGSGIGTGGRTGGRAGVVQAVPFLHLKLLPPGNSSLSKTARRATCRGQPLVPTLKLSENRCCQPGASCGLSCPAPTTPR